MSLQSSKTAAGQLCALVLLFKDVELLQYLETYFLSRQYLEKAPKSSSINGFMDKKGVHHTIFERVLIRQEKQVKI